jgi:alpha-tubulin suppressor-like RCC1 family protein
MPFVNTLRSSTSVSFGKKRRAPAAAGGQLWAWGGNFSSRLIDVNTGINRSSPVQIASASTWTQVAAGRYHAAGIVSGSAKTWGTTSEGALGDDRSGLGPLPYASGLTLPNVSYVSASGFNTKIIKNNGQLWTWGQNNYGVLGLGDAGGANGRSSPVQVGALTNWAKVSGVGSFSGIAIKTDGTLWLWGQNNVGQLGLGNTTNYSSPKQIGSDTDWATLVNYGQSGRFAAAIKTNGTLWTWGSNSYPNAGALGHNNTTNYSSPKQVPGVNWAKIAKGYRGGFTATKTDGTLWTWGGNNNGQLGLNDTVSRSSPVQIGALTNWARPIGGYYHQACIKTDGTLWAWGKNNYGQLGQNDTTNRSSPVQIGALTSWITGNSSSFVILAVKSS